MNAAGPAAVSRQPVRLNRWVLPPANSAAASLAQSAGLPLIVAELLAERGVRSAQEADLFLHPRIEHLLDPYAMQGMTAAVTRVQAAIAAREAILIYGDYDVDGTTAIVLLKTALEMLGGVVDFHVPHRLREGYGMQEEILAAAAGRGVRLVISVDTGIRAFAAAEAAARLGVDLIITDHHLAQDVPGLPGLPDALAILNPNQPGCGYACKHLCGAGVAFKLAQALLEAWDADRARGKILPSFLKMLAIATVADAVPLLGENRVFASVGLEQLRRPASAGLRSLMLAAKLDPKQRALTATDLAFRIAPRINAAGRMDVASDVVELFTTRDVVRAGELAAKLDRLNSERQQVEAGLLEEIERRLRDEPSFAASRCIVIEGEGWHRGIIGILASRVVDRARRPAIVIAIEDGEAYGSGRSVPGFHLLQAIEGCKELFTRFGGHAHAVGFCLPASRLEELKSRLESWASLNVEDTAPILRCHAVLPLDQITEALYGWLRRLEPLGNGNEEPIFVAYNVRVTAPARAIKDRHVCLQLAQGTRGASWSALGWDWAARVQALGLEQGSVLHLAYKLRQNQHPEYGGLELEIADLAPAG
ncbi:MAG: single-stranded-DNA-specific exonuclease RecJ [Acidobacteriaceae bacterium]